jgi:RNA polymerase sigma-70 factor (ECF subfamily)
VNEERASARPSETYAPALIEACRRGERSALERVLGAESRYLERVLSRLVGAGADLEDLVQVTLEQAIRAFPAYRGEASVRTWLTRIGVRTAMHHLKSPARKRRVALEVIEGGQSVASSSRPANEVEARLRLQVLHEHLEKLDVKHRTAFVLFQVEERPMEEVAALMDASLSATKSRVMWARRKLFARLRKDPRTSAWLEEYGEEVES